MSQEDLKLIGEWLKDPEAIKRGRDPLFLYAAKKKYLDEVIWATAAERHKQLDDTEWLVAYFTAQDILLGLLILHRFVLAPLNARRGVPLKP